MRSSCLYFEVSMPWRPPSLHCDSGPEAMLGDMIVSLGTIQTHGQAIAQEIGTAYCLSMGYILSKNHHTGLELGGGDHPQVTELRDSDLSLLDWLPPQSCART